MKIRTAATTALLFALACLPVNPLLSSTAQAVGLTQTAPSSTSARRSTRTPPRAARGLAPSPYFDRGTRVPLASPALRQRPRNHVNRDRHRHQNRRPQNRRIDVSRPQAGSIGLRRGNARVNSRTAGPAIAQSQRTAPRRVDRRTPHASRDTAGISFWPKRKESTIPRTAALRAPQFPYTGSQPGTRSTKLSVGAQRFSQHGATWYFSRGHWYRPHRLGGFAIVLPPIGLALPFLPTGSKETYYEGQRYYVAGGVTLRQADGEYLVVNAPEINASDRGYYIAALDQIAEPVNGQSERRFGRDVDRCAGRAEARSGYDPEREDASRAAERRYAEFSRSLSKCLKTAGYSLY